MIKRTVLTLLALFGIAAISRAEAPAKHEKNNPMQTIQLNLPNLTRGSSVMQALAQRRSTKSCSPQELSLQDLSDLLWAANGINRPESGKRTAPSAMNRQDVKVYVCLPQGSYLYHPDRNRLELLTAGDVRPAAAPVVIVLVTDTDQQWAAMDAGIVSQNISIFCAGTGLATYPRASMDKAALRNALKLTGTQTPMLCHPTGYFEE